MNNQGTTFQDRITEQLSAYKQDTLKINEPGIYQHRGKRYEYDHILPVEQKHLNILQKYRDDFFESDLSNIGFHKYFHHLNSSQALCINLFYPLIISGETSLLGDLLGVPGKSITSPRFEFESDVEDVKSRQRKTNFDFFFRLQEALKVFVEVKYTEREFGSTKADKTHIDKFYTTYAPLLDQNPFIHDKYKQIDVFLNEYQIMRNLVHISENSIVVFVYPEANTKIRNLANYAHFEILTEEGRQRLKLLPLEKTISFIREHVKSEKLKRHYKEFEHKYL